MKYLTYLFMFIIMIASVSAICYNQDNSPFCSKDDPTCTMEDEIDSDGDGWSDSCDAIPDNEYLWVDYDGDNIGWGTQVYDCDDLDETTTTLCGDTNLLETPDDSQNNEEDSNDSQSNDDSQDNGDSGDEEDSNDVQSNDSQNQAEVTTQDESKKSRGRSEMIYVSNPNDNFVVQQVEAADEEEEQETTPTTDVVPLEDPVAKDSINTDGITVTGTSQNFVVWPYI